MMRNTWHLLRPVVLLLVVLLLAPALRAEDARGPLLWEIEGANGPTYLLGTVHLGVAAKELPPFVHAKLRASKTLVIEADPRALGMQELMTHAMLPEGESLRTQLSPEHWKTLTRLLGGLMPEPMLERQRPWFVSSLLLVAAYPGAPEMDRELLTQAESNGKQLEFLEAVDHQLNLLSKAITLESLVEFLDDPEQAVGLLQRMIDAYRAGDHSTLEQAMFEERHKEAYRHQFELLFDKRNREWLPRIERYTKRGDVFIAVGAGHLFGEDGLVALLRARGLRVTRP